MLTNHVHNKLTAKGIQVEDSCEADSKSSLIDEIVGELKTEPRYHKLLNRALRNDEPARDVDIALRKVVLSSHNNRGKARKPIVDKGTAAPSSPQQYLRYGLAWSPPPSTAVRNRMTAPNPTPSTQDDPFTNLKRDSSPASKQESPTTPSQDERLILVYIDSGDAARVFDPSEIVTDHHEGMSVKSTYDFDLLRRQVQQQIPGTSID